MRKGYAVLIAFAFVLVTACGGDVLPRPQGFLAMEYDEDIAFAKAETNCDQFNLEISELASLGRQNACNLEINYPSLNATVFLTYKTINGDLREMLIDAQKMTYKHSEKAGNIQEFPYVNPDDKKYGMFYRIEGDAASNTQFYLTDSINHFLNGSVYFNVRSNYDSILPAADYLANDVRKLMESVEWKSE